uniref:Methyltransferase domain-containing protein n=2 Tax=Lutzomyia longipalpis TaxID=7200 RepID=A0A1B0C8Q7_LUTLO
MSALCGKIAEKCGVEYLVDIGGGLGHLSRILAFGHGKRVCCVEKQEPLNLQAGVLDQQFLKFAQKYLKQEEFTQLRPPVHLNLTISPDMDACGFIEHLKCRVFDLKEDEEFAIGVIGLHPCGDLGPVLLNLFQTCPEVKFIAVVGCCYMKLTENGFPLSQHLRRMREKEPKRVHLSYEAREVACHAIEMYHERLSLGEFDDLKIHAYRSALEKVIVRNWPNLRHSGLRSVKYRECRTFREYCERATGNLGVKLKDGDVEGNADCLEWKKVAIFYTLRLMLAPLVESVLLNDRLLSIREGATATCSTVAVFEPRLSPRNHILLATK